jgi:hypothetical protein
MLVRDPPLVVYFAKTHGQPEQETVLVRWVARRVRPAAHDRDGEGDVLARGHSEFLEVEGRSGLVIAEEQVPGLFVRLDALALQGRRQVEHHHTLFLIEYDRAAGRIMSMQSFGSEKKPEAAMKRLELEIELLRRGETREVVLLEAASEDALRKTHRRYFEDLATLAAAS